MVIYIVNNMWRLKMELEGSLKVIKRENRNKDDGQSVYIFLENPDDKTKIIMVSIFFYAGEEHFTWNTLINLEVVNFKDIDISPTQRYYYKGCEIFFESDRETWQFSAIIGGNYDLSIRYREIYRDSYHEEIAEALDLIDEAIKKKLEEKKEVELLYEKANNFYYGEGVEKDYKKAFDIFKDLADNKEHLGAMEALCYMYYQGKGTDVDYELARKYCEKVEQKNGKCNRNIYQFLGEIYFEGLDVESDYIKAKAYFEKALNNNYDDTYYKLGLLNSGNYGIEKDQFTADSYFNKIEQDLLLSIIYLLLAIRPEEEQNLKGIYKCLDYSREEYSHIIKTNIPFDHLAAIYYKKVDYLQDNEYDNIVKILKEKIEWCLQEEVKIEKGTFPFENEHDVEVYTNTIVTINK